MRRTRYARTIKFTYDRLLEVLFEEDTPLPMVISAITADPHNRTITITVETSKEDKENRFIKTCETLEGQYPLGWLDQV